MSPGLFFDQIGAIDRAIRRRGAYACDALKKETRGSDPGFTV
jgi:hypothetical protein